jgi:hypothetical protein
LGIGRENAFDEYARNSLNAIIVHEDAAKNKFYLFFSFLLVFKPQKLVNVAIPDNIVFMFWNRLLWSLNLDNTKWFS